MFPSTSKKNLRPGSGSPAPSVIDRLNAESEKPASADVPFEDNPGTQTGRISSGDAVTSNVPKADEPLLTLPLRQQRDILLRAAKERPPYFTTAEDFKPHSWVVSAVSSAVLHGANYVLGNFPGERVTLGTNDFRDAYEGAREDLLAWRRRAQRAEATLRSIAEHTTEWLENHNPMAATLLSEKSLTAIIEVMDKNEIDFKQDKYRHIVTGDYYAVEAVGETQTSVPLGDKALVVVYRSDKDGRVWVRPEAEFRQRFAKAGHVTPAKTVKKDEGDEFVEVTPSAFESWYSAYSPAHKGDKQRARDAYAAGMGDPLATAAPTAVAGPSEFPHEQMDAVALARYKVVPSHESMLHRHVVVAGDGSQQLYIGREVECENMARKFAGAFLDGAFAFHSMLAAAPPTYQGHSQKCTGREAAHL